MLHKTIDMAHATRLTRQGRLREAMAVLQGAIASSDATSSSTTSSSSDTTASNTPHGRATIDMLPPSPGSGGAWTSVSDAGPADTTAAPRSGANPLPRSLMAKLRSMPLKGQRRGPAQTPACAPGAHFDAHAYVGPAGRRDYRLYVPSRALTRPPALLVMLHGCTQSPEDFAAGTGMNALAEAEGWLVVYPAQPQSANSARCWNWFNAADQTRDGGEPAIIAGITRAVMAAHDVDPARVYVAGLSAGGAAAAIMGAAYPDLFAAVGVHSGLAPGAATDVGTAFAAMRQGSAGHPVRRGRVMPTIVFHGDRDRTVHPVNGEHVLSQAGAGAALTTQINRESPPGLHAYTRTVHTDAQRRPVLEHWLLHGAGHAWSGGSAEGSYTDPQGPDASREMMRFFAQQPGAASR
jgi:poly(hydroxyalkanoate) depolymerase family esterase